MADSSLDSVVGAPPPAGIAALAPGEQAELAELVAQAREAQSRTLEAAFEAMLKNVPFPVRGIVRRMLRG